MDCISDELKKRRQSQNSSRSFSRRSMWRKGLTEGQSPRGQNLGSSLGGQRARIKALSKLSNRFSQNERAERER